MTPELYKEQVAEQQHESIPASSKVCLRLMIQKPSSKQQAPNSRPQ